MIITVLSLRRFEEKGGSGWAAKSFRLNKKRRQLGRKEPSERDLDSLPPLHTPFENRSFDITLKQYDLSLRTNESIGE